MLLPASFGASRRMNDSHDIRKNLRFRNAELARQHSQDNKNEWGFNLNALTMTTQTHAQYQSISLL